jgi:hypothetical protein
MKGFKNTTRTQYSMGGDVYAKGGMAKGAAKISKVMGEFKKGELHSGSKDGPKVTKPAQAKAIAMSEARKAGMKAPMKKNEGGKVGKMPPLGESVKSGNRMSKMTAAERLAMEARFGEKKRPSPGDSVKSGNRIAKEEADEARHLGVFKEGGKVRKYAEGGPVEPAMKRSMPVDVPVAMPMPDTALGMFDYSSPASSPDMNDSIRDLLRSYDKYAATGKYDMPDLRNFVNDLSSQFTDNDRIAAQSSLLNNLPMRGMGNVQTPEKLQQIEARKKAYGEHSRREAQYRQEQFDAQMRARQADLQQSMMKVKPPLMMELPTPQRPQKIYEPRRPPEMLPPTAQMPMAGPGGNRDFYDRQVSPEQRARNEASMADGSYAAYYQQATGQPLPQQQMMELPRGVGAAPQAPRRGLLGALNNPRIREDLQQAMMQPPPAGMAPVDPRNVTMMKHGGRTAMPKGKR